MDYLKIYENIIARAKNSKRKKSKDGALYERHHIIPKSIGGLNNNENLVLLTPKEHFICHKLLCLIHKDTPNHNKMYYALWCMINGNGKNKRYIPNSKEYEYIKCLTSKIQSENGKRRGIPRECIEAAIKTNTGSTHSEETKELMRKAKLGRSMDYNKKPKPQWLKDQWSRNKKGIPRKDNVKSVSQFTKNGEFIKKWNSVKEAKEKLNILGIDNNARGESKSAGGYVWKYTQH